MMMRTNEEIELILDELINSGKKIVDETKIIKKDRRSGKILDESPVWKKMEKNQMRNLLEVALSIDSIKAIELFIEYQIGRNEIPDEFGKVIINKINKELMNYAKDISNKTGDTQKKVLLTITRQYLGYLNRYFVYKKAITS